ncbi:type II toxin-antitoxin system RelE/ParE family toxin [Haloferula sp. BvORR071]|uniref:type II toxin-antitoxin system RelE/ParE family toxin n=1 Tax=Haloferula sp. BvORR071 TaxID=1396141 RepID=UPI00054E12E4|nr:type II toxin-antitoxin system RelE/ParE family toxin [Haloferula sp. BvORR071]
MTYSLHPEAAQETREAIAWSKREDRVLALRFRREIDAALQKICSNPLLYRCFDGEFRRCRTAGFPYALVFRIRAELEVIAVMHQHREPGYWKDRDPSRPT